MMNGILRHMAPLLLFLAVVMAGPASGSEVTGFVQEMVDEVLSVMEDPSLKGPEQRARRRALVTGIINKRCDFEEFSRRALSWHWDERTPEEKKEFVGLFTRVLMDFYMAQIEEHTIKEIVYRGEAERRGRVEVRTFVVTDKALEKRIDYRLKPVDGRWVMYDVIIEGVSLIKNYRTQFDEVLTHYSYEELVRMLSSKVEEE
jgi:phospholipid transport system substrate-binding protein